MIANFAQAVDAFRPGWGASFIYVFRVTWTTRMELALLLGIIGTVLGVANLAWLFIEVWWTRRLEKCLNLDISCEQKKAGQENYLIMTASVANVGGARVSPETAELTLTSDLVEFFDKTKSTWAKEFILDCSEFLGELIDPKEVLHRGYAVKTKGTGLVDITFQVTSPGTFTHEEAWVWKFVKYGCVT